jgi:hypothetical protein
MASRLCLIMSERLDVDNKTLNSDSTYQLQRFHGVKSDRKMISKVRVQEFGRIIEAYLEVQCYGISLGSFRRTTETSLNTLHCVVYVTGKSSYSRIEVWSLSHECWSEYSSRLAPSPQGSVLNCFCHGFPSNKESHKKNIVQTYSKLQST